jgi:hypothetical protein
LVCTSALRPLRSALVQALCRAAASDTGVCAWRVEAVRAVLRALVGADLIAQSASGGALSALALVCASLRTALRAEGRRAARVRCGLALALLDLVSALRLWTWRTDHSDGAAARLAVLVLACCRMLSASQLGAGIARLLLVRVLQVMPESVRVDVHADVADAFLAVFAQHRPGDQPAPKTTAKSIRTQVIVSAM